MLSTYSLDDKITGWFSLGYGSLSTNMFGNDSDVDIEEGLVYGIGINYKINKEIGIGLGYIINNATATHPLISGEADIKINRLTFFTGYKF